MSTRGAAPRLGFKDALLAGLARDGGLYVPESWPSLSRETIRDLAGKPYAQIAKIVLKPFVAGEIDDQQFSTMVDEAYAGFHHQAVVPLVQIGPGHFVMELFHGPTLAFKDVAMQLLARLMDHVLAERKERATIIGATSGDTGGAAIEAFRGRDNTDIFILFPKGKVSPVQQRQMTTVHDANVHPIAIEGNFDDCQALVKQMFNHHEFRDRMKLSGVNSINWGRIMAQIVYYFSAATSLGSPERAMDFCVPTGNFGDIFAGYVARKMGLAINQLIIATNDNDILARCLASGRYETTGVLATTSPSMDIQVSSNFERLLYEASGRDGEKIIQMMSSLAQSGAFSLDEAMLAAIRKGFAAGKCSEAECAAEIRHTLAQSQYLLDPHSAVGVNIARKHLVADTAMITLATAHPAKFPDAVAAASGIRPALPLWQGDLMAREEKFTVIANNLDEVEDFISGRSRA